MAPAMDQKRLEEIKKRAKAATKGPWANYERVKHIARDQNGGLAIRLDVPDESGEEWEPLWDGYDMLFPCSEDVDFIAHARTDIPELLAELERLRAWIEAFGGSDDVLMAQRHVAFRDVLGGDPAPAVS